jgi:ribosome maturation factor RimP
VELKGSGAARLLRVYIDKPGGVTHEDCRQVSEHLSVLLDVEDPIPGHYTLEVSSPGLDRELTRPRDYEYFLGRRARLVLREPVDRQRVLEGQLAGFTGNAVRLEAADGTVRDVELQNISRARLLVDF